MYITAVRLCQFFGCGGKLFSKWEHVSTKKSYWVTLLWSASQCVYFIKDLTLFYSVSFYFVYFSCTTQIHKVKFKSEYYLRINIGNRVKMRTPAITLWFPEQCLLVFFILEKQLTSQELVSFILEKQLTSQDMFLIKSKLSITAYLFLVLYRSTSLQSLLFLKNIKTFLCK